jgi:hypothetical protein
MNSRDDVTRTYRKTTVTEMKWIWASEYSLSLFGMGETLNEYRMVYAWWMPAIKTSENAGTVSVCWLQVMMHGKRTCDGEDGDSGDVLVDVVWQGKAKVVLGDLPGEASGDAP